LDVVILLSVIFYFVKNKYTIKGFEKSKRELGSGPTRLPPAEAAGEFSILWVYLQLAGLSASPVLVYRLVYRFKMDGKFDVSANDK
jgi:hypothetical protein